MTGVKGKIVHELRELVPVTLFFLIGFLMLALTQRILLAEHGVHAGTFAAAAVGALVVAKVVVIADHLPLINRFPNRPLIYNVVWKTSVYFAASFAVRYAEHVVRIWRRTGSFGQANRALFDEIVWPHFWCVQMWLLVLLLVYCTGRELIEAVGRERVFAMFFGGSGYARFPGPGVSHATQSPGQPSRPSAPVRTGQSPDKELT